MTGPFLGSEALASGDLSRRGLRACRAVYRDVYLAAGVPLTALDRARAAWLWSQRRAVLAGLSAAAVHRTRWIDAEEPAELNRASGKGVAGIVVHRDTLCDDEISTVGGMRVTTPSRTAFDLGRRRGFVDAVLRLDALCNATGITPGDVATLLERHRGARGIVQLRRVLTLVDGGAESPQESRTRLALMGGGLPRPRTQIPVYDEGGYPFARLDMGYQDCKVGVEYDGAQHWTDPKRRAHDLQRQVELADHGWTIVRVDAAMLRERRWLIVRRTVEALRRAGCTWLDECPLDAPIPLRRVS
ncbi:hypothetical protein [Mycolicibacterium palauense]|uniref:hypothetical protein n=1 Tax=Mycolicibacterium palauense TaxID=2034511 RepID=UPI000BFEF01B|nr:hypothetical protein [Mycolicibacterium palauense]